MRCVTRRSNSAVVSVCWPVIVSSIGSMTMTTRLGCFGSGLASFDSMRARNDRQLAGLRDQVVGRLGERLLEGLRLARRAGRRAATAQAERRARRRDAGGRAASGRAGRSFAFPLEEVGLGRRDLLQRGLLQDLGAARLAILRRRGDERRAAIGRCKGARGRRAAARSARGRRSRRRRRRRGAGVGAGVRGGAGVAAASARRGRGGRRGRGRRGVGRGVARRRRGRCSRRRRRGRGDAARRAVAVAASAPARRRGVAERGTRAPLPTPPQAARGRRCAWRTGATSAAMPINAKVPATTP